MLREVVLGGNLVESDEEDFDKSKSSIFSSTLMVHFVQGQLCNSIYGECVLLLLMS